MSLLKRSRSPGDSSAPQRPAEMLNAPGLAEPDVTGPGAPRRWFVVGLVGVLVVAALLRLAWIDCGLPNVEYVDAFKFVDAAHAMARAGDFEPRDFQYPALYANLLALIDRAFHLSGSPYAERLAARLISAFAGIALVGLVARAGRGMVSDSTRLLAAMLAALSVVLVTLSRLPLTDLILTLLMTAGLTFLLEPNPRARHAVGTGILLGLAVATKWTGLYLSLFCIAFTAIRLLKRHPAAPELLRLATTLLLGTATFLAVNHRFIPHFADYARRFRLELEIQKYGQIGSVQGGWLDYIVSSTPTCDMPWLSTSLLYNFGPALALAAAGGVVLGLARRQPVALAFHALYVVLYLALISGPGRLKAVRFVAPVIPSLLLLAAAATDALCQKFPGPRRRLVFAAAALLLIAVPLVKSIRYVFAARLPMTPVLTENWIAQHLADETNLCVSPFYLNNLEALSHKPAFIQNVYLRQYRLPGNPAGNAELNPLYGPASLDALRSLGARYYVCNSWFDGAFLPVPENRRWFPVATATYAEWRRRLETEGTRVWAVRAQDIGCLGPDVEIWRLDRMPSTIVH